MKSSLNQDFVSHYIPDIGLQLAKYSGEQLIERVGQDAIKDVVTSILCGGNVRSLTEGLTQRRIALSNAALLVTYLQSSKNIHGFQQRLYDLVSNELQTSKLNQEQRIFLQWLIGLTGKSVQNVLRSDQEQLRAYLAELENALQNTVQQAHLEFGEMQASIALDGISYEVNWHSITQIFTAIGSQTLAIRGSEKSLYGKLFEKLVLGSVLTILGFEMINPEQSTKSTKVFWLSQRENKRESDATLLIKPGVGVRFDIGFIGPGNTEISLDKVSRFEREMEFGRSLHFMSTIILVDRIGENSRISELAQEVNGHIVQMSMAYWVKELCHILKSKTGFHHKILKLSQADSVKFIHQQIQAIDLNMFV
jgi:hypothetical protein